MFRFLLIFGVLTTTTHATIGSYEQRSDAPLVPIHDVQGSIPDTAEGHTHASAFHKQMIQVQGIVHQRLSWSTRNGEARHGFVIQSSKSLQDDSPNTSEGLMCYAGKEAAIPKAGGQFTPQVGDEIIVSGLLSERYGQTELGETQLENLLRRKVDVDQEVPAVKVNPPNNWDDAMRYWERLEGMRVEIPEGVMVTSARKEHSSSADAMVTVINPDHIVAQRKNPYHRRVFRDAHPLDDEKRKRFDNGNGYRYVLGSFGIKGTKHDHLAQIQPLRTFDTLGGPYVGSVIYNWGQYKVAITQQVERNPGINPADNGAPPPANEHEISIASYNIENLYDRRNDPSDDCDFPDDPGCPRIRKPYDYVPEDQAHYEARLVKIARHIMDGLHAPDLIMLQELEDQDAFPKDKKHDGLIDLVKAIRTLGGPRYGVGNDRLGADTRGIVCGFLYRPDRIQPMRPLAHHPVFGTRPKIMPDLAAFPDNAKTRNPKAMNSYYVPEGKDDPEPIFSRAVQVAGFIAYPEKRGKGTARHIYLLNNHFSSRPDAKVDRRKLQATYNAAIYSALKKYDRKALIIVGGDLNVYPRPDDPLPKEKTDQLGALYEAGMINLYDRLLKTNPASAYTYVYQGQAQTLDHLFISANAAQAARSVHVLHVNADYPHSYDAENPYGASDHDPLVARFKLW